MPLPPLLPLFSQSFFSLSSLSLSLSLSLSSFPQSQSPRQQNYEATKPQGYKMTKPRGTRGNSKTRERDNETDEDNNEPTGTQTTSTTKMKTTTQTTNNEDHGQFQLLPEDADKARMRTRQGCFFKSQQMPSPSLGKALLALLQNPTCARHQPDCKKPGTQICRVPGTRGLGLGSCYELLHQELDKLEGNSCFGFWNISGHVWYQNSGKNGVSGDPWAKFGPDTLLRTHESITVATNFYGKNWNHAKQRRQSGSVRLTWDYLGFNPSSKSVFSCVNTAMLGVTSRVLAGFLLVSDITVDVSDEDGDSFNENWEEAGGNYEALLLIFDSVCSVRKLKSLTAAGLVSVGGEASTELVQAECSCNVTSVTQLTLSDPQHIGPAFDNCKLDLVLEDNHSRRLWEAPTCCSLYAIIFEQRWPSVSHLYHCQISYVEQPQDGCRFPIRIRDLVCIS
ncbi:hypothetical protein EV360DRAFT_76621 [Lentinula raphanica]|nr:hypothetical protein EV360DRAFT_76621 [Lentinula raphanica]